MKTVGLSVLLLWSGAAQAQVQARYSDAGEALLWEVAADGDYRVGDPAGRRYRLSSGGKAWEVAFDQGRWHVATAETLAEARRRTTSPLLRAIGRHASAIVAQDGETLIPQGRDRVAGWPGVRYRYARDVELWNEGHGRRDPLDSADDQMIVVSDDPRLLPLGETMRRRDADDLLAAGDMLNRPTRNRLRHSLDWLASHGTVLSNSDGDVRLIEVTFDAPAPERLRLPQVAPHDVDTLIALIRARRDPFR